MLSNFTMVSSATRLTTWLPTLLPHSTNVWQLHFRIPSTFCHSSQAVLLLASVRSISILLTTAVEESWVAHQLTQRSASIFWPCLQLCLFVLVQYRFESWRYSVIVIEIGHSLTSNLSTLSHLLSYIINLDACVTTRATGGLRLGLMR